MIQYIITLLRALYGAYKGKYKLLKYEEFERYVSRNKGNVLATPYFIKRGFFKASNFEKTHGYKIWFNYNGINVTSYLHGNLTCKIDLCWDNTWKRRKNDIRFKVENYKNNDIEFYAKYF